MKSFLKQVLKWMEREGKVMEDIVIRYPNGEELTFAGFWLQVVEDRGYGGRCAEIYKELEK